MLLRTSAFAAMLLATQLHADVTLRYKSDVKLNPSLPPQMAQQMGKGLTSMPLENVLQLKNGKGYASMAMLRSIVDFTKGEMKLIDPESRRYTVVTPDQFAAEMAKMLAGIPAEARQAMASMKATVDTRQTGRSATILGIEADEAEVVIAITGPPVPNMPAGPMVRMVMQLWTAKQSEVLRVPALRELTGYNLWAYTTMNPAGSIEKMFQQMPGMGDSFGKFIKEMQTAKAALLRSRTSMYMPAMAAMMKQLPPDKNPFGAGFDAETPLLEMTQELAELSSAPVPDAIFEIPADYKAAPASEMIQAMFEKQKAAARQ
jgi:hypothetical protein